MRMNGNQALRIMGFGATAAALRRARTDTKRYGAFGAGETQQSGLALPNLPPETLYAGLGGLLGYFLGKSKGQEAIGALVGVLGGMVLAKQMGVGQIPVQGTYVAPKNPGTTQPGATPTQNSGNFDWNAASSIVSAVVGKEGLTGTVNNVVGVIKQVWSPSTKKEPEVGQTVTPVGAGVVHGDTTFVEQPSNYVIIDQGQINAGNAGEGEGVVHGDPTQENPGWVDGTDT